MDHITNPNQIRIEYLNMTAGQDPAADQELNTQSSEFSQTPALENTILSNQEVINPTTTEQDLSTITRASLEHIQSSLDRAQKAQPIFRLILDNIQNNDKNSEMTAKVFAFIAYALTVILPIADLFITLINKENSDESSNRSNLQNETSETSSINSHADDREAVKNSTI
ncbi:MAG: hypothetical protein S4CHLAM20_01940 [Chlamydiia bacterium]|nr:hypothetical protein [Chlamydiia bacterium]